MNPYLTSDCICGNNSTCIQNNKLYNYFYCGLCEKTWKETKFIIKEKTKSKKRQMK